MKKWCISMFLSMGVVLGTLLQLTGVAVAADVETRTLQVKVGGSDVFRTSHPFKRVSVADPRVADVVILSPREVYVLGKNVGSTRLMVWEDDLGKTLVDLTVVLDLSELKQKIGTLFPGEKIEVHGVKNGLILSGTVSGPDVVEQVLRLTQKFLPDEEDASRGTEKSNTGGGSKSKFSNDGEGTGKSDARITNLLKIGGVQQVMLEVKFAEVSRDSQKDWQAALGLTGLGKNFTGAAGTKSLIPPIKDASVTANFPTAGKQTGIFEGAIDGVIQNPGSLLLNFAGNAANVFVNIDKFTTALQLLEGEGLARTLAEPKLVTQSGQEASFLAGGEFPIPVPQSNGNTTIEFKKFGVALTFTPIVLGDGKISLRVSPTVSEIASVTNIPTGGGITFPVPSFNTRTLNTTVQMYDGQTLALAGLLKNNLRENVTKIPGLGDLPIIGALFRSSAFLQEKTDLLVAVTPHIVNPVPEGSLSFPGDDFKAPNNLEFYLEGRLEGRRQPLGKAALSRHAFEPGVKSSGRQGGLEGNFGSMESPAATKEVMQ